MLGGKRFKNKGAGPEFREIVGFNPNVTSAELQNHRKTDASQATGPDFDNARVTVQVFSSGDILGEEQ